MVGSCFYFTSKRYSDFLFHAEALDLVIYAPWWL